MAGEVGAWAETWPAQEAANKVRACCITPLARTLPAPCLPLRCSLTPRSIRRVAIASVPNRPLLLLLPRAALLPEP